jgi:sugar lactone lactonase YvrE
MRSRIALALALVLLLSVAAPASAKHRHRPLDARHGIEVGRAAATNSLNGIYVSPVDGKVYVASVGGDEITVHHPKSGRLLDRIGPERGVHGPDDVFITDDGTIYWTEILTGVVGMLKPGHEPVHQLVGPGVNPITMSDDGRLFVGRLFLGQGLYELDPNLVDPPLVINEDLNVNSFDFGPDGHLYAPSFFTGEVLKIDVDSAIPVSSEVVANVGGVSSAVKFNSQGEAYAVNIGEGIVVKLDLSGADAHEVVLDVEGTIDNIAFNTKDVLFVAVGADNQIIRINPNGRTRTITRSGFGLPGDVAVAADGTLWVTELFAMRGFTRTKRPTTSFYDRFVEPGTGFAGATSVVPDGDLLLLTSGFNNALQVLDPATGAVSLDVRDLAGVTNAVRHRGDIVATQLATGTGDGNVVNVEDPGREVLLDGLFVPLGLASDGDTLYVGDWATGIVWAVDDAGAIVLASDLLAPEGMVVDGDRLLVVETGRQQVTAVDLATGATSPVIVGLDYSDRIPEGFFPFGIMSGIDVSHRWIYVSDDGVNKVYKFFKFRHRNKRR